MYPRPGELSSPLKDGDPLVGGVPPIPWEESTGEGDRLSDAIGAIDEVPDR